MFPQITQAMCNKQLAELNHSWIEVLPIIEGTQNIKGTLMDVLFFSNPNTNSGRYNITIKGSLDLGETWLSMNQLLIDERQCYGYSSLTKVDDKTIGILYEGVKDLYFVKVPVSEIIK